MTSCIIITYPFPLRGDTGGGTRSCLQIAENLDKLGVKVFLVPVDREANHAPKNSSVKVIPVSESRIHYLLDGIPIAKTVQAILDQNKVDAVLSWGHEAAYLTQLLQSRQIVFGIIAAFPSYRVWVERKKRLRFLQTLVDEWFRWRLLRAANVVFVSSNFTQQELTSLFGVKDERIALTYRGIDPIFFDIDRLPTGTISNFIFYGSLAPIKGIFDVLKALSEVATKGQRNWKLKIAGWGEVEPVKQSAWELGISENIIYVGCLEPDELVHELKWADLAILPSRAESFGRAISEAQAAGLPVVSYDAGSVPELVEPNVTGWLAPPEQPTLLADCILDAMKDAERTYQMGLCGRDRMQQRFSWEKTAEAILRGIERAKQQFGYER